MPTTLIEQTSRSIFIRKNETIEKLFSGFTSLMDKQKEKIVLNLTS